MMVFSLTTPVYNWHDGGFTVGINLTLDGAKSAALEWAKNNVYNFSHDELYHLTVGRTTYLYTSEEDRDYDLSYLKEVGEDDFFSHAPNDHRFLVEHIELGH